MLDFVVGLAQNFVAYVDDLIQMIVYLFHVDDYNWIDSNDLHYDDAGAGAGAYAADANDAYGQWRQLAPCGLAGPSSYSSSYSSSTSRLLNDNDNNYNHNLTILKKLLYGFLSLASVSFLLFFACYVLFLN